MREPGSMRPTSTSTRRSRATSQVSRPFARFWHVARPRQPFALVRAAHACPSRTLASWSRSAFLRLSATVLTTLQWMAMGRNRSHVPAFGFVVGQYDVESCTRSPARFWLPVCGNIARSGIVLWLECDGTFLRDEDSPVGFEIGTVRRVALEHRKKRFVTSETAPELVVHPSWPTIALHDKPSVSSTKTDRWGCRMILLGDEDDPAALAALKRRAPGAQRWSTGGDDT
jgi:hypothetical protein